MNSGLSLYASNSEFHADSLRGGKEPVTGRHSVILRPDSVSRVRPPKTTMPKTLPALRSSQIATLRFEVAGHEEVLGRSCVEAASALALAPMF